MLSEHAGLDFTISTLNLQDSPLSTPFSAAAFLNRVSRGNTKLRPFHFVFCSSSTSQVPVSTPKPGQEHYQVSMGAEEGGIGTCPPTKPPVQGHCDGHT